MGALISLCYCCLLTLCDRCQIEPLLDGQKVAVGRAAMEAQPEAMAVPSSFDWNAVASGKHKTASLSTPPAAAKALPVSHRRTNSLSSLADLPTL